MKKTILISALISSFVALPVFGATTLWEFYQASRQPLPSLEKRAIVYEAAGFQGEYRGTKEQNTSLLSYLQDDIRLGFLAPPSSTVEGTSTAGWTDDGSTVRLNTASDFVGIGTANPADKLSVVGGDASVSGDISLSGGDLNIGGVSATSTLTRGTSGLGLGTTSPVSTFSVQGGSFISGTTTTGVLQATSTIVTPRIRVTDGVQYTLPATDGTNGQFMSTNGSGTLSFTSSSIDQTGDFAWSGNQRFNNGATTTSLVASSTAANPLKLNTLSYAHPSSLPQQATSTLYVTATTTGDVINLDWRFPDGGQLASTSLNTALPALYATVTPHAFYDLNILVKGASGSCTTRLIFNNDRGLNYAYQVESNGGAGTPVNGDNYIPIANQSTTSPVRLYVHIQNLAGFAKGVFSNSIFTPDTGTAALAIQERTSGIWANTTTTISTIGIYMSGCNFTAGTMMEIKGSSD